MQHLIALRFHHSTDLHLKVLSITAVHALIFLQEQLRCLIFAPASMLKRACTQGSARKPYRNCRERRPLKSSPIDPIVLRLLTRRSSSSAGQTKAGNVVAYFPSRANPQKNAKFRSAAPYRHAPARLIRSILASSFSFSTSSSSPS